MKHKVYETIFAGHTIHYSLINQKTRYYFHPWLRQSSNSCPDIRVDDDLFELAKTMLPEGSPEAYVEYRCLIELTAKKLLEYGCCIFHCVSFVWEGYAWLLTAPSGTGKTTQFINWNKLFPGEITMISGDMPVLEKKSDGSIWAHPSTWNGKENIGSRISAPVAGIFILKQGCENNIRRVTPAESIMTFFDQFIVRPESEDEILSLAGIIDQILTYIPVWEMVNRGDLSSTRQMRHCIETQIHVLRNSNDD